MNLYDHPPFVLLGNDHITLTVMWHHSRWAWWKASLTYWSFDLRYGHHPGALHGSLVADRHTDPTAALDALVEAAHVMAINLEYPGTPTLSLHAYSTDGTPSPTPRHRARTRPSRAPGLAARPLPPPAAPDATRASRRAATRILKWSGFADAGGTATPLVSEQAGPQSPPKPRCLISVTENGRPPAGPRF